MNYYGSYYLLKELPIWTTALIFGLILVAVLVGRDFFEGLAYNVSYSSSIGDVGLLVIVLIGATILKENRAIIPEWLQKEWVHIFLFILCILIGIIISFLTLKSRSGQEMDIFHDVVIVPIFLYLLFTLMPLIYKNGTWIEKTATVLLFVLWTSLVVIDNKQGRINQREWLQNHGVTLK